MQKFCKKLWKKIILGTSDTWLMSHLSQRPSKPAYLYWRLPDFNSVSTQSSDWHPLVSGPPVAYCNLFASGGVGGSPHSIASRQMGSSEGTVEKDPVFSHNISFSNFPVLVTCPSVSQTYFTFWDTSTRPEASKSNSEKNVRNKYATWPPFVSCSHHRTTKFPNSESPIFCLLAWSNSRARHSAIYILKSHNLF